MDVSGDQRLLSPLTLWTKIEKEFKISSLEKKPYDLKVTENIGIKHSSKNVKSSALKNGIRTVRIHQEKTNYTIILGQLDYICW